MSDVSKTASFISTTAQDPDHDNVTRRSVVAPGSGTCAIEMEYGEVSLPREPVELTITVEWGIVIRARFRQDNRGNTEIYVVQLEWYDKDDDRWHEVIRFDNAHGFPHVDHLNRSHRSIRKDVEEVEPPYNQRMNDAIDELRLTYQSHIDRFRKEPS
jgi:hypothetical protein